MKDKRLDGGKVSGPAVRAGEVSKKLEERWRGTDERAGYWAVVVAVRSIQSMVQIQEAQLSLSTTRKNDGQPVRSFRLMCAQHDLAKRRALNERGIAVGGKFLVVKWSPAKCGGI
jgi:hypothetical protein